MASVKMNKKALLEKLQAEITLKVGKKMSQQDILDKSVEFAYNNFENFISANNETPRLTKEIIERIKKNVYKGPLFDLDKSDDEIIYGLQR
ncbi:MAG: hypothetical protein ACTSO8_06015 [Promethearchaeota archaeon]